MNTKFDTNRFVENSSPLQLSNGTIQFMDTQNPGVFYTAHRNGNVNRVFKTSEIYITNTNNTTESVRKRRTRYTRVNYRLPNNGEYVKLHRLTDQLSRIQESADSYKKGVSTTYTENDGLFRRVMVSPR